MMSDMPLRLHALIALGLAAVSPFCAPAEAKPNIVVIMTDDQRDADPLTRMPNTQALLVDQGVRFTNSFVVNPVCCASRASFLSGQYSHNNGVWDNKWGPRPGGFKAFLNDGNALPVWLQEAGYRTAMIGKYLNGYGSKETEHYLPPGWDYWWGLVTPFRYYDYQANDNGIIRYYGLRDRDYQEDVVSRLAQKFIADSTQPFFLWITGIAPHAGYPGINVPEPPLRYKGYFDNLELPQPPNFNEGHFSDKPVFMQQNLPLMDQGEIDLATDSYRRRAETVLAADDMVGAIIAELQQLGELDNTYIIFTSDNGFFQGEHRVPIGKHLLYEEALRVPLVVRGPNVPQGETRTQMINNLDLTAAIAELAGAAAGRAGDGKSLVPLLTSNDVPWRTAMLLEGDDELPDMFGRLYGYYAAVRTESYKYAEHVDKKERHAGKEFYDVSLDPYELRSRTSGGAYRSIRKTLQGLLASLKTCQGEACWVTTAFAHRAGHVRPRPDIAPPCRKCSPRNLNIPADAGESSSTR